MTSLTDRMNMDTEDLIPHIKKLISTGMISILYGDKHPNPYIRALQDDPSNEQVAKLIPSKLEYACIYPQPKHLESVVNKQQYYHLPYTLRLALGAPLYTYAYFDPAILIHYSSHPECTVINDIQGVISLPYTKLRFSKAVCLSERGHALTELIALTLEQLSSLKSADQQYWHTMSLPVQCQIHPDVHAPFINGEFRKKMSVFEAIHEEIMAINGLCPLIGKPLIFDQQSIAFNNSILNGFLVYPSTVTFKDFFLKLQVQLLQNINNEFLNSILSDPIEKKRGRRTVHIRRPSRTPLEHIECWLKQIFSINDKTPVQRLILLIKNTRQEISRRLRSEHQSISDPNLLHLQRRLVWNTYLALRWIRTTLEAGLDTIHEELHPLVRAEKVWI